MKWLLVVGALALVSSFTGCCQGGLFSQQPAYGSYYQPSNYYSAPTTYASNPCGCQ